MIGLQAGFPVRDQGGKAREGPPTTDALSVILKDNSPVESDEDKRERAF
jgi:hypothetical protein